MNERIDWAAGCTRSGSTSVTAYAFRWLTPEALRFATRASSSAHCALSGLCVLVFVLPFATTGSTRSSPA